MQQESLFKDALPALPPPREEAALPQKRYAITLRRVLRALCLAVALSVLSLCAYQKLNVIFENGVLAYINEEFLKSGEAKSLGDRVSAVAFGNNSIPIEVIGSGTVSMPKIFYIPKEELIRNIEDKKEQTKIELADLYSYDLSKVPSGYYPIIPSDSSTTDVLALKNDTSYQIDMEKVAKDAKNITPAVIASEPLVLVVHTHGTESFSSGDVSYYSDTFNHPRSEDVSKNVVAVGKVLCEELNKKGIPTLHCETMHDKESYIAAYDRSAESIKYYMEKYPSIQYVFDVHRDSLIRSDLTKLRPVTLRDGKACAQIMMIIGSDEKGAGEYDWEGNLTLAAALQQELFNDTAAITRKLYLRGASYNQQYAKHGLLLEIGSCGNTLAEAKEAAKAFAVAFEKVIKP